MVVSFELNKSFNGFALMLACLCLLADSAWAQDKNIEKSFPNVVMIDAKIDGQPGFGAGIVIGTRAGRIYIATADHVVRSGRREATDIQVRFRFLPGVRFDARLLEHKDKGLDVAIISVAGGSNQIPEGEFKFDILGVSGDLERGSDVHPLGNPSANAWGVALNPEKVDNRKATVIAFQSSYIQGGHSGGALLDSCGDVVGMIVRDNAPNGEAVRIESVLDFLKQSNYPVDLNKTGGCAGGDVQVVDNNGALSLSVGGTIAIENGAIFRGRPIVALVWSTDKGDGDISFDEQAQLNGLNFQIDLNGPPPDPVLFVIGNVRLGIGALVVYDDANGDGIGTRDEMVGGSPTNMITYLQGNFGEAMRDAGEEPDTMMQLPQGYALTRSITPQERGKSGGFDDLVPIPPQRVYLIVPKNRTDIKFPNWT
ncbi:exported protein of unknown function [uncultured Woeseiaceae bacterium]|uniref:Serine protease n=1 Tax=uncultured Woeseiaceae bacterium TaxID=1983305 RepID=A0A7D9D2C4_9GAMM|nr:exported protein of unknown function [uncultured Woeseiaceae bacterium]